MDELLKDAVQWAAIVALFVFVALWRSRAMKAEAALRYYADAQNTVRECMAGGHCANCDLTQVAHDYFGTKRP